MTRLPTFILRLLERRLPPRVFDSAAGDLEERWHADRRRSPFAAWARLLAATAAILWHARDCHYRAATSNPAPGGDSVVRELMQDLRFAWRLGRRQPWLSAAAVGTLALGIAATTAIFSVVNAWVLTPLPYHRPDRLAVVWETIPSASIFENTPAPASLREWRERSTTIATFAPWTLDIVNLTGAGDPARLTAAKASRELLPLLGVSPVLGRNFTEAEVQPHGPPAALLTHASWLSRFGGRSDIVGQRITLSGTPATVVGVLPPGLRLLQLDVDLWIPLTMTAAEEANENRILWVFARLRDGATVESVSAEVDAIMRGRSEGQLGARAVPLREQSVGDLGRDILVLFGATGLVLLIACANVASLAMARITGRRQELVVRVALGAGRMRIVRQILTESAALALVGAAAGLLMAGWAIRAVVALAPRADRLPPVDVATPAVFLFAAVAAFASAGLFGLFPAWQCARVSLAGALREGSHAVTGGGRLALRSIVVGEMALALALLVGAALVARSYQRLAAVDVGFDPTGTVAFQIPRPSTASPESSVAFYNELLRRLSEQTEIHAAGLIQALPLRSSAMGAGFRIEGRSGDGSSILSYWRVISPGYFRTLGIPLLSGRSVAASDVDGSPLVAVVTESFARRAWPDDTPLGKRIGWGTLERPVTVVGVVGDIRTSPAAAPVPHVYMPFQQVPHRLPDELVVRSGLGTAAVIDVVRRTVWGLDRAQPVAGISTMEALFDRSLGRRRFHLTLFSLFAGVAVALAMVGVYGVLSYMVSQMAREVGLRLALGATPGMVVRTVLTSGLWTAAVGIAVGMLLAVWSAGLLRGFLFQLDARDPMTYAAAGGALIAGSIVACLIPALRAARVDPLSALRN